MKRATRAGVLVALAGLSGCIVKEVYVGDDAVPCRVDADCVEQGLPNHVCEQGVCEPKPTDPTWACLGKGPPASSNDIVPFELAVTTTARIPITNARVRACSRLEPAQCNNPIGAEVLVDASGLARLEVPESFDGYFEVYGPKGPDVDDPNFVRMLVFAPPREIERGGKGRAVYAFSLAAAQGLVMFVGATFDSNTGLVIMSALDCTGAFAPNITFDLTSAVSQTQGTKQFYMFMNIPSPDATQTDTSGTGGFTNLNEGSLTLSATISPLETPLVDEAAAFVRNGWISYLYVSP